MAQVMVNLDSESSNHMQHSKHTEDYGVWMHLFIFFNRDFPQACWMPWLLNPVACTWKFALLFIYLFFKADSAGRKVWYQHLEKHAGLPSHCNDHHHGVTICCQVLLVSSFLIFLCFLYIHLNGAKHHDHSCQAKAEACSESSSRWSEKNDVWTFSHSWPGYR